jgi:hypothetical protein
MQRYGRQQTFVPSGYWIVKQPRQCPAQTNMMSNSAQSIYSLNAIPRRCGGTITRPSVLEGET